MVCLKYSPTLPIISFKQPTNLISMLRLSKLPVKKQMRGKLKGIKPCNVSSHLWPSIHNPKVFVLFPKPKKIQLRDLFNLNTKPIIHPEKHFKPHFIYYINKSKCTNQIHPHLQTELLNCRMLCLCVTPVLILLY
jgi:hypothetical protein